MKKIKLRKLFWYLILALPILAYLFCCWGGLTVTFSSIVEQFALPFNESFIGSALVDLFGSNGYVASLTDSVCNYFVYFIGIELMHIVIDVLLFLPKFMQKCWERLDHEKDS